MFQKNKLFALGLLLFVSLGISSQTQSNLPKPTENQLRWQEMEMYAFIHYSLNTYTDQEWGFGNEGSLRSAAKKQAPGMLMLTGLSI